MDDFARATSAPKTIRLGGREYLVGKYTPRDIGDLQAWLKEQIPNPKEEARKLMEGLSDAVALEIWREAVAEAKSWPPSIADSKAFRLLSETFEGNARLIWVSLRRFNPGITPEVARDIAQQIDMDDLQTLIALASPESKGPKAKTTTETIETQE